MIQYLGIDKSDLQKSFDEEIDRICKKQCKNTKVATCIDLCHSVADEIPITAAYRAGVETFENLGFTIKNKYIDPREGLEIDTENTDWAFVADQFFAIGLCLDDVSSLHPKDWLASNYNNNPKTAVLTNLSKYISADPECLPWGVSKPNDVFENELLNLLDDYRD